MGRNDPDPLPDFLVLQTPDMDTGKSQNGVSCSVPLFSGFKC